MDSSEKTEAKLRRDRMKPLSTLFCIVVSFSAGCGDMPRNARAKASEPILTGPPQMALPDDGASIDAMVNRAGVCRVRVLWNYSQEYVEFKNGNDVGKASIEYANHRNDASNSLNLPVGAKAKVNVPFHIGDKVTVSVKGPSFDRDKCTGTFLLGR